MARVTRSSPSKSKVLRQIAPATARNQSKQRGSDDLKSSSPSETAKRPATSPLTKFSLPTPARDNGTKSSPLKQQKKVMFAENLTHFNSNCTVSTPRRSILKQTSSSSILTPQNDTLLLSAVPNSPATRQLEDFDPSKYEFWVQGNIPRINENLNVDQELIMFKKLLTGALTVLKMKNCDKRFEIYATLNLLFKDLNDKKLIVLISKLHDLLNHCKVDLLSIESKIFSEEDAQELDNDPFLIRINTQITRILTNLLSNLKLLQSFWKRSIDNFNIAKWCINHSCSILLKKSASKSLVICNLQLIKDHKLHSQLNIRTQEYILYSIINMKYFNSASLLVEKLYTLKSLLTNHTSMMEKNIKSWLDFLFNCLCDFNLNQKSLSTSIITLLEVSKLFLTSNSVHFEIKNLLNSPLTKIIDPPYNSNFLQLSTSTQTTLEFITDSLTGLVAQGNTKIALDYWLGVTLLLYNNIDYLNSVDLNNSRWFNIILRCFDDSQTDETKLLAIKIWRGLTYVLTKDIDFENSSALTTKLILVFKIFSFNFPNSNVFLNNLVNSFFQIVYALGNNKQNQKSLDKLWNPFIIDFLESFFFNHRDANLNSNERIKIGVRIFNHLISQSNKKQSSNNYLMRILSLESLSIMDLDSFLPDLVFKNHKTIWKFYLDNIFSNNQITFKNKFIVLTTYFNTLRITLDKELSSTETMLMHEIMSNLRVFIKSFFTEIEKFNNVERLDYINKLILLIKTSFGYRVFFNKDSSNNETLVDGDSIYSNIIMECLTEKNSNIKISEVLKIILINIKTFQYKFMEYLALKINDPRINQYILNNLESKIFEKNLSNSDISSISIIILQIPKTITLLKNLLIFISNSQNPSTFFFQLCPNTWSSKDFINLNKIIFELSYKNLKPLLIQELVKKIDNLEMRFDILNELIRSDCWELLFAVRFEVLSKMIKSSMVDCYINQFQLFIQFVLEMVPNLKNYSVNLCDELMFNWLDNLIKLPHKKETSEIIRILVNFTNESTSKTQEFLDSNKALVSSILDEFNGNNDTLVIENSDSNISKELIDENLEPTNNDDTQVIEPQVETSIESGDKELGETQVIESKNELETVNGVDDKGVKETQLISVEESVVSTEISNNEVHATEETISDEIVSTSNELITTTEDIDDSKECEGAPAEIKIKIISSDKDNIFYEGSDDGAINPESNSVVGTSSDDTSDELKLINVAELDSSPVKFTADFKSLQRRTLVSPIKRKIKKPKFGLLLQESVVSDDSDLSDDAITEITKEEEISKNLKRKLVSSGMSQDLESVMGVKKSKKRKSENAVRKIDAFLAEFKLDQLNREEVYEVEDVVCEFMKKLRSRRQAHDLHRE